MSNRLFRVFAFLTLGLLLATALAACSGGNPGTISVTETEDYKLQLSSLTAPAGQVTFNVKNNATTLTHEFVVVQTDTAANALPLDADGNVDETKMGNDLGEAEDIAPGESKTVTVNMTPGHYVLMCNMEGHYKQGMYTDFTVK